MSAAAKPVGTSLKVKVIVALSPTFKAATLLVIARVGGIDSRFRLMSLKIAVSTAVIVTTLPSAAVTLKLLLADTYSIV